MRFTKYFIFYVSMSFIFHINGLAGAIQDTISGEGQSKFSFDDKSFSEKMRISQISLNSSAPVFIRKYYEENLGKAELDFAITHYECQNGLKVSLLPMVHFAMKNFYSQIDQVGSNADVLLYEGIRLNHFFGPPFEKDSRFQTIEDYNSLTSKRLQTISEGIISFRKVAKRNPISLDEVGSTLGFVSLAYSHALASKTALDPWGNLFQFSNQPDGSIKVLSLGADQIESADDISILIPSISRADSQGLPTIGLVEGYTKLALAAGLDLQSRFEMQSYLKPTSLNADVSMDMLNGNSSLSEKIAANNFRNVLPIIRLDELLLKNDNSVKSVAIMYGAIHMLKFHQFLIGSRFGCVIKNVDWIAAISVDKNLPQLTPQQFTDRVNIINTLGNLKPALNPDPLGFGQVK